MLALCDLDVVLSVNRGAEQRELWLAPVAGGPPLLVTTQFVAGSVRPFVSFDGGRIRYRTAGVQGHTIAFECDLPSCASPVREDVTNGSVGRGWTPDGDLALLDENDVSNIWLQPIKGGAKRRATNFTGWQITDFAWSRDGKHLVLTRSETLSDIVLVKGIR